MRNQLPLPEPRTEAQKKLLYHMAYSGHVTWLRKWWVFYGSRQLELVVGSAIGCSIAIGFWSFIL